MIEKRSTAEMQPLAHYRVTVVKNESYQLPAGTREVMVLSGGARLTVRERDHLLARGDKWAITTGEVALVNANDAPVVLDMGIKAASEAQKCMKQAFYERMALRQQLIEAEHQAQNEQN